MPVAAPGKGAMPVGKLCVSAVSVGWCVRSTGRTRAWSVTARSGRRARRARRWRCLQRRRGFRRFCRRERRLDVRKERRPRRCRRQRVRVDERALKHPVPRVFAVRLRQVKQLYKRRVAAHPFEQARVEGEVRCVHRQPPIAVDGRQRREGYEGVRNTRIPALVHRLPKRHDGRLEHRLQHRVDAPPRRLGLGDGCVLATHRPFDAPHVRVTTRRQDRTYLARPRRLKVEVVARLDDRRQGVVEVGGVPAVACVGVGVEEECGEGGAVEGVGREGVDVLGGGVEAVVEAGGDGHWGGALEQGGGVYDKVIGVEGWGWGVLQSRHSMVEPPQTKTPTGEESQPIIYKTDGGQYFVFVKSAQNTNDYKGERVTS